MIDINTMPKLSSIFTLDENVAIESNICMICYEKNMDCVLQPCGHGGMCYTSSLIMWKETVDCHICRHVFFN